MPNLAETGRLERSRVPPQFRTVWCFPTSKLLLEGTEYRLPRLSVSPGRAIMATFFCSDPHAFHGNIMKYCRRLAFMTAADREEFLALEARGEDLRSFRVSDDSIDGMNRALADNINSRVGPNDVLWCLGDWVFGQGRDYYRKAKWFRDQLACRSLFLVWGNHDDRRIRDLFTATFDQTEIRVGDVQITLNHYPMLTWNGQHHGSVAAPNIHLYGHVHALYQSKTEMCPVRDADAWPALDVGFDGHDYQVWSLAEILVELRPKLAALEELKKARGQFDPFRGRGQRVPGRKHRARTWDVSVIQSESWSTKVLASPFRRRFIGSRWYTPKPPHQPQGPLFQLSLYLLIAGLASRTHDLLEATLAGEKRCRPSTLPRILAPQMAWWT